MVKHAIAVKYHVNEYLTLKLYRHSIMNKREYRRARFYISLFCFKIFIVCLFREYLKLIMNCI
jgi:hypothetical protein